MTRSTRSFLRLGRKLKNEKKESEHHFEGYRALKMKFFCKKKLIVETILNTSKELNLHCVKCNPVDSFQCKEYGFAMLGILWFQWSGFNLKEHVSNAKNITTIANVFFIMFDLGGIKKPFILHCIIYIHYNEWL